MNGYVHASEKDNLVTCVRPMRAGEIVLVDGREITVRDDIPKFHKLSIERPSTSTARSWASPAATSTSASGRTSTTSTAPAAAGTRPGRSVRLK